MHNIIILILSVILGFSDFRSAERSIAEKIKNQIEDVEEVKVKIDAGFTSFVFKGKIKSIEINLIGLETNSIRIEKSKVVIKNLYLKTLPAIISKKIKIKKLEGISWQINISEEDLEYFLRKRDITSGGLHLELKNNEFRIKKYFSFDLLKLVKLPVFCRGTLKVMPDNNLYLLIKEINTFGFKHPKILINAFTKFINPILKSEDIDKEILSEEVKELQELKLSSKMEKVVISEGKINIFGSAKINN